MPLPRTGGAATAALACLLSLCACNPASPAPTGGPPTPAAASSGALPAPTVLQPSMPVALTPGPTPLDPATGIPEPPGGVARVPIRTFKEPNDYAHRNYCGAGATEVLLSAWEASPPGIETVARASHLNPNSGETGANALAAINSLLAPVVEPVLGQDRYTGAHATALSTVLDALRRDLADPVVIARFGHGVPVMVQTMTRSMPGWNGWNATHMITIFAADLRRGDDAVDTVTYAETPSTVAAYTGPPTATITVQALWVAMQQFLVDSPRDPINLIS